MCRSYTDEPASVNRTSADIGDCISMKLVDKFCYLGDMPSVDAAVKA